MKGKRKNYQKGITLIALVITIIILLILAGVTINIVLNSGLMNKSQTAVDKYSEESAKEKLSLAIFNYKMGYITGGEKDLVKYIDDNKIGKVTGGEESTDTEYIIEVDGYEFIVKKENLEITSNGPANAPKPTIKLVGDPVLSTDKKKVTLTIEAKAANGGNLTVTVDGKPATLSGNVYVYEVTTNGNHTIKAKETNGKTESMIVNVTGIEVTKYTVTINKGTGIDTVTQTSEQVEEEQSVEITATVTSGYVFSKWTITDGTGTIENETSASTTVTPAEDIIIQATAVEQAVLDNINGTANAKVGSGDFAFNNPVVPVGFRTSNEGASWSLSGDGTYVTGWNDGLVIQDGSGNQFVWVPVDGTNVTYDYHYSIGSTGSTSLEQSLPTGILDKNSDGDKENDQITEYGGFYIARYEAGIPESMTDAISTESTTKRDVSGIPVSKKNQVTWNYISWSKAQANAKDMYKLADTNNHVQSVLITDRMWETTMQWLEKANPSVNVTTNSTSWGNYSNSTSPANVSGYGSLQNTGYSEYWKAKNIYDLAGNVCEWMNAKYGGNSPDLYVKRGGSCINSGTNFEAAFRHFNSDSEGNNVTRLQSWAFCTVALNTEL